MKISEKEQKNLNGAIGKILEQFIGVPYTQENAQQLRDQVNIIFGTFIPDVSNDILEKTSVCFDFLSNTVDIRNDDITALLDLYPLRPDGIERMCRG